jgi:hypothetical protein
MSSTVDVPVDKLLLQVAGRVSSLKYPELKVNIPRQITLGNALDAARLALGDMKDQTITTLKPRTLLQQNALRETALELAAREAPLFATTSKPSSSAGLPINVRHDLSALPAPKRPSKETIARLKENLTPLQEWRDPYPVTLGMSLTEDVLPIVKGNLVLSGFDEEFNMPFGEELHMVDLLWDTGAEATVITEDILSQPFLQSLRRESNVRYSDPDRTRVLVSASLALSNSSFSFTTVATVVKRDAIPNFRSGILFGQLNGIDRFYYQSVPRQVLNLLEGKHVDDRKGEIWGEIVLLGFVNDDQVLEMV